RVFSAHLHMDEATPHLHIDFVPFTTGSKRGLETRVSLKQALAVQGFTGGTRHDTEWNQWAQSEKEQLAAVMARHGIEWEQKGTHEQHLSVLDYEKKVRTEEVAELGAKIEEKQLEIATLESRIANYQGGIIQLDDWKIALENDPEFQLPEPTSLMSAKTYRTRHALPLVIKLKNVIEGLILKCLNAIDRYNRLRVDCGRLYNDNDFLRSDNRRLTEENMRLKDRLKDYSLLRKVFGSRQMDDMVEQAKQAKKNRNRAR
ncbi:MAG: recombinase, partial [Ruminococcaceae bacterium]|nr:recombinase [Oscillospiraceae bacterium]